MYDLIGDTHGHATELAQLLTKLGYTKNRVGVYEHPTRKVMNYRYRTDKSFMIKMETNAPICVFVGGNHHKSRRSIAMESALLFLPGPLQKNGLLIFDMPLRIHLYLSDTIG